MRSLGTARAIYEQMYRRVGGIPVRPRVVAFLDAHAAPMLRATYDDKTGRELYRAVGGLVALAGICAYDANLQSLAQRYLFQALRMAKASRNRGFGGYVVALLANQAMFRRSYRQVIQYAETALRAARGRLSPALMADLHTLQAKAYAYLEELLACQEQMRFSESTTAKIRPSEEPPETGYIQPGLLECQHAEALWRLGDLDAALPLAEEAVRTVDPGHIRGQAHRLATLASVLVERGEVDRAAAITGALLDRTQGMESQLLQARVLRVTGALGAHNDHRDVREVLERARRRTDSAL